MTGDQGARFGKFRGTVADNEDPRRLGRIRALVPTVFGNQTSGWALPCSPAGYFAIPAVGAGVWIEFEQGDPDLPIWTGCWWASAAEMQPGLLADPQQVLLQTSDGHSILLDDTPGTGGITLHNNGGQTIALTGAGIELDNGRGAAVSLQGPIVSLNRGALEVT
jgi:Type VI secretion system/phage-baseplate injector OB domain